MAKQLDFAQTKVLVVGDVMLDRYWHGPSHRVSPEAPVPVVQIQQQQERPGGAANLAHNLASLGAQTTLLGVIADDDAGQTLQHQLVELGITPHLLLSAKQTIVKLRVLSHDAQLLRLDFEDPPLKVNQAQLIGQFTKLLPEVDTVVFSDYGKGTLAIIQPLLQAAKAQHKTIVVDPKGCDFSPYIGADLLIPNRTEFYQVVGAASVQTEFFAKAQQLCAELSLQQLLITCGQDGMYLFQPGQMPFHVPSAGNEVFDVTGASDTVCALMALGLSKQYSLRYSAKLANAAAGIAVTKLGAQAVRLQELQDALGNISEPAPIHNKQLSLAELAHEIASHQAMGEKIVFTNGCFDVLHAGHVTYLNRAKALGDRLVVAINTDESIQQLDKGPNRPYFTLKQRLAVLASLQAVDWVIPFSEDTPCDLLTRLKPDVLVKGGDYKPEEIVGYQLVQAYGGRTEIVDHPYTSYSSTDFLAHINTPAMGAL